MFALARRTTWEANDSRSSEILIRVQHLVLQIRDSRTKVLRLGHEEGRDGCVDAWLQRARERCAVRMSAVGTVGILDAVETI